MSKPDHDRIYVAARKYCQQGFAPIPIPRAQKGPVQPGRQNLRISEQNLHRHFNGRDQNIGVLLGQPSGGLVDVDLDCLEAERLAESTLPSTYLIAGRKSKPKSHFFYKSPGAKTKKFMDPEDRSMLVEIRSDGCQTLFPPSTHPTGEAYNFANAGEPAVIGADELIKSVSTLAGIAALSKHWPPKGSRQDAALALAGALLRKELGIEWVERIIRLVCSTARDDEILKRVSVVRITAKRLATGDSIFGFCKLKELVGSKIASRALDWLTLDQLYRETAAQIARLEHSQQALEPQSKPLRAEPRRLAENVVRCEPSEEAEDGSVVTPFPEIAWRGIFAEYREAMSGTTEASDVAHFAAIWTAASTNLGRRVSTFAGDEVFPNVYILFYGPTGDKKTTAQRRIFRHDLLVPDVQVLRNVGSPEGMSDGLQQSGAGPTVYLCLWEEFSTLLAHGRWKGSSILEFLTETYDCPPEYRIPYRNHPVVLREPTPSILACTTSEWFWKNARTEDFHGGFGNRFVYLTGKRKAPIPSPAQPDEPKVSSIRQRLLTLASLPSSAAVFSPEARSLYEKFYVDWECEERRGIYAAAVKRIHVNVRKLAMVYAACEATLPEITFDQTKASIAVATYAAECVRFLVEGRFAHARPEGELEQRFLEFVTKNGGVVRKRYMQQTLSKYAGSCEVFNRIMLNLLRADLIEVMDGKVYLTR